METVTDFVFLGSKITVDGDCSHEIKRGLLLERKAMTNIDNVLKGRHQPRQYTEKQRHYLADKSPSSQSYGFSRSHVWMRLYPYMLDYKESWGQKNWCFELLCWRRLLRVPWTARRSNQSILKEISPEYPLERLMLKLKLKYFDHLMGRTDSLEKTWCWERFKAREEGNNRGWECWMVSLTQ